MERLVQPELTAGLFARSVDTAILAAFAIASHVSPDCTTRVVLHWQVGGCTQASQVSHWDKKGNSYESNPTLAAAMHKTCRSVRTKLD
jgi:hypothetical protein